MYINTIPLLVTIAFHTMYQAFLVFLLNNHIYHNVFGKLLAFYGFVPYPLTQN
ncbi:putative membrane protein [Proteus mirabilis]|nr:putative membrane protein [Proteus mirabilis]